MATISTTMVPVPTMTPTHRSPRHPRRPSRPPPNRANRARRRASILGGDRHAKAVERVTELDLARKPRLGITVGGGIERSDEHTSALQSLMRISYADFCLKTQQHTSPNH